MQPLGVLVLLGVCNLLLATVDGFAVEMPDNMQTGVKLFRKNCVKETGVDEALIDQSRNGYLPDDPKLACYIHCIFDMVALVDRDTGMIRLGEISQLFPIKHKEVIERITDECGTIRKWFCKGV